MAPIIQIPKTFHVYCILSIPNEEKKPKTIQASSRQFSNVANCFVVFRGIEQKRESNENSNDFEVFRRHANRRQSVPPQRQNEHNLAIVIKYRYEKRHPWKSFVCSLNSNGLIEEKSKRKKQWPIVYVLWRRVFHLFILLPLEFPRLHHFSATRQTLNLYYMRGQCERVFLKIGWSICLYLYTIWKQQRWGQEQKSMTDNKRGSFSAIRSYGIYLVAHNKGTIFVVAESNSAIQVYGICYCFSYYICIPTRVPFSNFRISSNFRCEFHVSFHPRFGSLCSMTSNILVVLDDNFTFTISLRVLLFFC